MRALPPRRFTENQPWTSPGARLRIDRHARWFSTTVTVCRWTARLALRGEPIERLTPSLDLDDEAAFLERVNGLSVVGTTTQPLEVGVESSLWLAWVHDPAADPNQDPLFELPLHLNSARQRRCPKQVLCRI